MNSVGKFLPGPLFLCGFSADINGMDDFELEIKNDFINEALLNLEEAESAFMDLESSDDRKPLLELIFRLAHNLKGGARAVGFADVAEFTHHLENLVLKIQKDEVTLTRDLVSVLLQSSDRLVEMLTSLKSDLNSTFDNKELVQQIEQFIERGVHTESETPAIESAVQAEDVEIHESAETSDPEVIASEADAGLESLVNENEILPPSAGAFFEAPVEAPVSAQAAVLAAAPAPVVDAKPILKAVPQPPAESSGPKGPAKAAGGKDNDEVVRVSLTKVDQLNDYVGELIVWQSMVQQQAQDTVHAKLNQSLMQVLKISKEIQEISMSLRLLPVKPLIQKLQRVVRDTSQALGKEIELVVEGEQLEIDKTVLDRLADPLIHILRNGVDHGVEEPQKRIAAGKSPKGRLTMSLRTEGSSLLVEVRDDGNGIDPQRLRTKAIEKGIIKEADVLTERQLINLIFHAGFSTKTVTSEISGRGVGMDVVKTNVEKAGGQVEVNSVLGQGSQFLLRVPLSMAVIDGLVVMTDGERTIIPLSQVQETLNLRNFKLIADRSGLNTCFELRGHVVPVVSLTEMARRKRTPVRPDQAAILVNFREKLHAIAIDDIVRSQQVVIKPIASGVPAQKGFLGSAILGDGLPTLIIGATDLIEDYIYAQSSKMNEGSAA